MMFDVASDRSMPGSFRARAPHAVVIGSGFGGLAAAIRLGVRGYRVTVLEKLGTPGGRGRVHRQDGFTFDAGPTLITAPFLFEELWTLCGRRFADDITLKSLSPFYRIRFANGDHFDCSADQEAMEREVARFSPSDIEGYRQFMKISEETFQIGFVQLAHVPFQSFMDMVRIAPDLLRLQGYRSVYSMVSKYIKDERLRQVFSFHPLLIGGNPLSVTSVYCMISYLERYWGVHYSMGGIGSLHAGMVRLIQGQGNNVRCNAEVAQITVENATATGVVLKNGERIAADIVVSNADSAWMYKNMIPPEARRRWTDRKLDRSRYSTSLFVWYFGTNRKYPDVLHHTIMLGPRYKELLDDIFKHKILAQDFSLYLHRPSADDDTVAPEGCDAFYVLSPVPHLESGVDWSQQAEAYRQAIARHLEETLLPDLSKHVVTSRLLTPQIFHDELNSLHGAGFGLEPVLTQSAWFRPHNKSEDIERLYLVGAGTHPGAGLPGVLSSARALDSIVPDPQALVAR